MRATEKGRELQRLRKSARRGDAVAAMLIVGSWLASAHSPNTYDRRGTRLVDLPLTRIPTASQSALPRPADAIDPSDSTLPHWLTVLHPSPLHAGSATALLSENSLVALYSIFARATRLRLTGGWRNGSAFDSSGNGRPSRRPSKGYRFKSGVPQRPFFPCARSSYALTGGFTATHPAPPLPLTARSCDRRSRTFASTFRTTGTGARARWGSARRSVHTPLPRR